MSREVVAGLVAEVGPRWQVRQDARLVDRPRQQALGTGARYRLVFIDRLLATLVHLGHGVTYDVPCSTDPPSRLRRWRSRHQWRQSPTRRRPRSWPNYTTERDVTPASVCGWLPWSRTAGRPPTPRRCSESPGPTPSSLGSPLKRRPSAAPPDRWPASSGPAAPRHRPARRGRIRQRRVRRALARVRPTVGHAGSLRGLPELGRRTRTYVRRFPTSSPDLRSWDPLKTLSANAGQPPLDRGRHADQITRTGPGTATSWSLP